MKYALKNILAVYYNNIITYERYRLDIVLNISLQNSHSASRLPLPNYRNFAKIYFCGLLFL